ncbi:hypothetical protein DT076_07525 [Desertihabitans brevis]|uniref:Ferredoxin reductase n=1 Tax=Desertihabitans brevis TaxID=2268447 RepID=A0A367YVW2_9ACTN|nr:FAD-dependent oxidoreductase [Desertihabitans brevis]RCK69877.1 hypothetical protein DT076_07525 [Desertihabitans brevis]
MDDADGRRQPADTVVLATGGTPALPPVPGVEHARTLRTRADADRLRADLGPGRRLVVVGAGLVGSEVAATATRLGTAVTLVDPVVPLVDVLGWDLAVWLHLRHRERGVTMVADLVRSITPAASGTGTSLAVEVEGAVLPADVVLVATGLAPVLPAHLDPAPELAPDGAVLVDELGRTSVPGLLAVGDCSAPRALGRSAGHWEAARLDGEAAAAGLLGGSPPARGPSWFWSDRHGHHLEVLGTMADAEQQVVRGTLGEPPFAVLGLRGGRLVAAASVDDPATVKAARRLAGRGVELDAAALADPSVPLRSLLRR